MPPVGLDGLMVRGTALTPPASQSLRSSLTCRTGAPMNHDLFSPCRLGSLELTNRIVMAPMTRSRALGNVPNELMATYYAQRAEAGLIVTEGTSPSPDGLGYSRIPGLF